MSILMLSYSLALKLWITYINEHYNRRKIVDNLGYNFPMHLLVWLFIQQEEKDVVLLL